MNKHIKSTQLKFIYGYCLFIKTERFEKKHADFKKKLVHLERFGFESSMANQTGCTQRLSRAKMIKNNRARFEIVHNTYHLIAHIHYGEQFTEIRFIGTHTEYDRNRSGNYIRTYETMAINRNRKRI